MLGLRLTTDAQPRSKNGRPAQSTTGAAQASWNQLDAVRPTSCVTRSPSSISPIASRNTGRPATAAMRKRRVMSSSSGFRTGPAVTASGSSAMPQRGHGTGSVSRTWGHIGQT